MRKLLFASLLLAALTVSARDGFQYILTKGDGALVSGGDLDTILAVNERYKGAYLWARIDGKQYLIRDAATIAEARRAFEASDALHQESEKLRQRMKPVELREEELEEEMEDISDELGDREDLTATQRARMEARLAQLQLLAEPLRRQLRELEQEEERLDQREERLSEAAEAKLKTIIGKALDRGVAQRVR